MPRRTASIIAAWLRPDAPEWPESTRNPLNENILWLQALRYRPRPRRRQELSLGELIVPLATLGFPCREVSHPGLGVQDFRAQRSAPTHLDRLARRCRGRAGLTAAGARSAWVNRSPLQPQLDQDIRTPTPLR